MHGAHSIGSQVNRYLDSLGLPDSYGDKLGALVDLKRGDLAGFYRNIADLNSGLSTRFFDRITGARGNVLFGRGYMGRAHFSGPHLRRWAATYPVHTRVAKNAYVGKKYDTGRRFFGIRIKGRVSGRQYRGSFYRPVRVGKSGYLYRGRIYKNMGAIRSDIRDGRVDGLATRRYTVSGWARSPFLARLPHMIRGFHTPGWNPANVLSKIFNQAGGLFGGIPENAPVQGGSSASTESVLSNPNLPLEDKLALLMAKLSEHLDKKIEDKMKEIENAMKKQGKKKKGGLFGKIGKALGSVPVLGGLVGGLLGGGGAGGAGGAGGKKPNLQLLQTQLQQLLQKRQQMFQTMTNILKSLHDTSMSAIRNLKT